MAREIDESIAHDGGRPMRALLALPDGAPPENGWPGVVVIHDIFGFSDDVRRIARRFADSGYAALAPALFDGAGPKGLCVVRTLGDLMRREGAAFGRVDATQRTLAAHSEVDGGRIGITGFCMGGGFALFYAARGGVQVCAPYYGDTPEEEEALRHVCPVIAGYGELDKSFAEQGRRLEGHLQQPGDSPRGEDLPRRRSLLHERLRRRPQGEADEADPDARGLRRGGRRGLLAAHARLLRQAPLSRR